MPADVHACGSWLTDLSWWGIQDYYHAMGGISEMRAQIQFPKLEPPPTDFLHQMEEYCKEAPRPIDPSTPSSPSQPQGNKKACLANFAFGDAERVICNQAPIKMEEHRKGAPSP